MSIKIMSDIWGMDLPDSQMIVCLALADCANDEGMAWPSIATIAWKCRKSERTVQSMIRELAAAGHLTREEVPGVGCRYYLHPRNDCTPAKPAPLKTSHPRKVRTTPPQTLRGTPAAAAPNPSLNLHRTLNPPTPRDGGRKIRVSISDDWKVPAVDALPVNARTCAAQWTPAAYAAQAEAFIQYHTGTGSRRADWDALWAAAVVHEHAKVMRDAKSGLVSAAPPAPLTPAEPKAETAAKSREDRRSAELHDALRDTVGDRLWDAWWRPMALIFADDRLTVVAPTSFHRQLVEERHADILKTALDALGWSVEGVGWEVLAPRKRQQTRS